MYHINAVDEITQWQVMACVPQISEAFLLPAWEQILPQFPFEIRGFHSDNGSESINRSVAQLFNKLLIEQTNHNRNAAMTTVWWKRRTVPLSEKTWATDTLP